MRATTVALLGIDPVTRMKKQSTTDLLDTSEGGMGVGSRGAARCSAAMALGGDGERRGEARSERMERGVWIWERRVGEGGGARGGTTVGLIPSGRRQRGGFGGDRAL